MADPVTWGVVLAASSATMSAVGAIRQGQAVAASNEYNATMARNNEAAAEGQAAAALDAQHRDASRKLGSAVAAYGASGVQLADGSPTEVLADSARSAALDALTLKYNYKLKGLGYRAQADLDSAGADNARTASYFNATGSMLSGGSKIAGFFA